MASYKVSPKYKKSVEEVEFLKNDKGERISCAVLWRGGEYIIHPKDEEEEQMLQNLDDAFVFEVTAFEDWELDSTWDGCSEDISYHGVEDEERVALMEEYYEENGFWDMCEEFGFDSEDCEIFIHNGVEVESWEGYNTNL